MLTVIVSALYGLFSVIFSSIFYAIFSVFNAIWSFIKFIYQTVLVDAIWKGLIIGVVWLMILKPTGIIGCQLIVVILKGFWYGVFIKERLMADGYFQAPQESSVRQFPFEVFKPPEWLQRSIGCVFGLVFGLRGILDVLSVVVISSWYGYDSKLFSIKGSVFEEIPENVYKSGVTRIFGLLFGFIVGFRCVAALLILIPVAAWKGTVLAPKASWSLFDSETKASGNWGLIFGNLFGFAVGWRWIINWLVYSLLYVPIVLILGSFLLGAIFGALSPPQWLISRYYCPTYKMNTLADLKILSFLQVLCFYIGAYTLGIAIGWSNWLQLFIMIPEFLARILWYMVLGSFYGVAPLSCHFKEGPIPPPVERGEIYDTLMKQIFCTIGAIAFGLFVGWRSIVNFLALIPVASWYGPRYIRMSHPLFSTDASSKTPKSITGKILGAVFGVIIGGRNWLNVITLVLFWTGFIVKMLALGAWFGVAPINLHNLDGYLMLPSEQVYSTAESKWICPIGALLFGLIIGWRTILNFVSMIPLAAWRGPFVKPYMFQGSTITRADSPVCITTAGRFFGAVFGLGMGFRFYCDLLLLIMSTALASSLGLMKNSWSFFVTSVKSIAFGIWFGSSKNVLIDEGYIKTVVVDEAEKFNTKARWIGAILGLIVGWRNIGNLVAITIKASYYGFDPVALHCNDGRFPQLTETPYKNKEITRWFSFLGFYIGWRNIFNFITIIPMCFWYGAFPRESHCADGFLPQPGISYEPPSYEEAVISDPSLRNAEANNEITSTKQEEGNWAEPVRETKIDIPNINQDTGVDVLSEHIPAVYKNNAVRILGGSIFGLGFGMRSLVNQITIIPKAMWLGLLPNVFHAGDGHLRRPDPECWKSPLAQICMGSTFGLLFGFRSLVNLASIVPAAFWYGCVGYLDIPDAFEISIFGKPKYPPTGYVGRFFGILCGGIIGFRNFLQLLFMLLYFLAVWIACLIFGGYYGLISTKYALKDSSFGLIETNPFLFFTSHLTNQTQYTTVYKVTCYINFAFCYLGASTLGLIIGWRLILANLEVLLVACYNGIWNDIALFRQYYILCSPKTYFESWEAYIYSILFGLFGFGWIFIVESVILWLKAVFFGSKAFQPNDDGGYMRRAVCWIMTAGLLTAIIMPTALQNSFTSERVAYTLIPSILAGIFVVENGIGNLLSFTWWFKTLSIVFQVVISIVGSAVYLPFWILLVFLKKLYATIFHLIIHGSSLIFDVQLTKSKFKARKAIIRLAASTIITTIITVILIVVVKASTRILLISSLIRYKFVPKLGSVQVCSKT
ncbi:hypothetical protein MP638_004849 [Amoeboaphelidium occidentale]|nr:hypothetical protein MP638_004849 [Amoeboaphelidium occidentale]